jgi:hypothetical protein
MQYRIKEIEDTGFDPSYTKLIKKNYYYPQYKKFLFWRRFVWWGGEDGRTPRTAFYTTKEDALEAIEADKEERRQKTLEKPKKPIYHTVQ